MSPCDYVGIYREERTSAERSQGVNRSPWGHPQTELELASAELLEAKMPADFGIALACGAIGRTRRSDSAMS